MFYWPVLCMVRLVCVLLLCVKECLRTLGRFVGLVLVNDYVYIILIAACMKYSVIFYYFIRKAKHICIGLRSEYTMYRVSDRPNAPEYNKNVNHQMVGTRWFIDPYIVHA